MDPRQLSFLVVEDHEFQRKTVVQILNDMHARMVHAATDGRSALALMQSLPKPVDVVVTDIAMPKMDGIEFIKNVGLNWPGTSLIVASALEPELRSAAAVAAATYGLNVLAIIGKPVTPHNLAAAIAKYRPSP
jgi:CheY-like chemotaxis protein